MTYKIVFSEDFENFMEEIKLSDPQLFERISKKIYQIIEKPHHYKPLRNVLKGCYRVHVGNFVLIYEINEAERAVIFLKFAHHDKAYRGV